jgi:hypothetical protein
VSRVRGSLGGRGGSPHQPGVLLATVPPQGLGGPEGTGERDEQIIAAYWELVVQMQRIQFTIGDHALEIFTDWG